MYRVEKRLSDGRAVIEGEFKDLYVDAVVEVSVNGRAMGAVVETRITNGAVVRFIGD